MESRGDIGELQILQIMRVDVLLDAYANAVQSVFGRVVSAFVKDGDEHEDECPCKMRPRLRAILMLLLQGEQFDALQQGEEHSLGCGGVQ